VNRKVLSGVLVGIGMLALSTTAAQAAGGGGIPFPLTSFFVCDTINGDDANRVVDIAGAFIGTNARTGVRVGNATLACAVVKLFRPGSSCALGCDLNTEVCNIDTGKCEILPNPPRTTGKSELKCYSVAVSPRNSGSPPPNYTFNDQLAGTDTGVQDSGLQYICGPAGP